MAKSSSSTDHDNPVSNIHIRILDSLERTSAMYNNTDDSTIQGYSHLIRRQSRTQDRTDGDRVNVVREQGEVARIQNDILLKAPIFMMQVVGALNAMLFLPSQTILTTPADATRKSDADEAAEFDIFVTPWSQGDNPSHSLVSTYVWELDFGDQVAICVRGGSCLGVKI